jgi:hypothetical protein
MGGAAGSSRPLVVTTAASLRTGRAHTAIERRNTSSWPCRTSGTRRAPTGPVGVPSLSRRRRRRGKGHPTVKSLSSPDRHEVSSHRGPADAIRVRCGWSRARTQGVRNRSGTIGERRERIRARSASRRRMFGDRRGRRDAMRAATVDAGSRRSRSSGGGSRRFPRGESSKG